MATALSRSLRPGQHTPEQLARAERARLHAILPVTLTDCWFCGLPQSSRIKLRVHGRHYAICPRCMALAQEWTDWPPSPTVPRNRPSSGKREPIHAQLVQ